MSLLRIIGVIAVVSLLPDTLCAQELRLTCENPRGEYLVVYQYGSPEIALNPDTLDTRYAVLVDDVNDQSHVVIAQTTPGGPTARLHLRPYLKMEFWSDGQLMQTDGCFAAE